MGVNFEQNEGEEEDEAKEEEEDKTEEKEDEEETEAEFEQSALKMDLRVVVFPERAREAIIKGGIRSSSRFGR